MNNILHKIHPIISIVGSYNVGKSTLFNFLTSKKDSLISNYKMLTRDSKYKHVTLFDVNCTIIDTGGIDCSSTSQTSISYKISQSSFYAMQQSDIILFLMDARIGLTFNDIAIHKILREKYNKKQIFSIVNKIEGLNFNIAVSEFYNLGINRIYGISSTNYIGVEYLFKKILHPWMKDKTKFNNLSFRKKNKFYPLKVNNNEVIISIVGLQNTGKSELINKFTNTKCVISCDEPGFTRENIYIKKKYNKYNITLIDTAGINKNYKNNFINKLSAQKTFQAIKESHISILLIDINKIFLSHIELYLINLILKKGNILILTISKCDNISEKEKILIKKKIFERLHFFNFINIYFVSSHNQNQVNNLFKHAIISFEKRNKKISTNFINKSMKLALSNYKIPMFKGKLIKLKYAHIGNYFPYSIIIHGNKLNKLSKNYKSYLTNFFYKQLNIKNIYIKLIFKNSKNPFFNKN